MLHLLWLIIKVIGIILLAIAGILLTLLLIVIFVPIHYEAKGSIDQCLEVSGKVHFLFHIFHIRAAYMNGQSQNGMTYCVRIAGFPFLLYPEDEKRKESRKKKAEKKLQNKKKQKRKNVKKDNLQGLSNHNPSQESDEAKSEEISGEDISFNESDVPTEHEIIDHDSADLLSDTISSKEKNIFEKIYSIPKKIKSFFCRFFQKLKNFTYTMQKMCDRIKKILEDLTYYQEVWEREETKKVLASLKKQLLYLLCKLKPSIFHVRILYGLHDAYFTGQILAFCSMFYHVIGNNIEVQADFENVVLRGDFVLKGKISAYPFVRTLLLLYFNKQIRVLFKLMKREEIKNG